MVVIDGLFCRGRYRRFDVVVIDSLMWSLQTACFAVVVIDGLYRRLVLPWSL